MFNILSNSVFNEIWYLIQNKTKYLQVHIKLKECHIESQILIYSCSYIVYALFKQNMIVSRKKLIQILIFKPCKMSDYI